jgi:hypothetical protein
MELQIRKNLSTVILFPTANKKELQSIKEELMADISPQEQDMIINYAWSKPYNFIFIRLDKPKSLKYYSGFDLFKFK